MKKILKYKLENPGIITTLNIHGASSIMHFDHMEDGFHIWVEIGFESEESMEIKFGIFATGSAIPDDAIRIATCVIPEVQEVWHLYILQD